jgi:hypothetical protein
VFDSFFYVDLKRSFGANKTYEAKKDTIRLHFQDRQRSCEHRETEKAGNHQLMNNEQGKVASFGYDTSIAAVRCWRD